MVTKKRGRHWKTVIVLGMHRSGTSMAAGVLHRLGVDMGRDLIGPMPSNPTGHYEDREFVILNEEILKGAGGSWHAPPSAANIRRQFNKFRGDIKKAAGKLNRGICGWKDPRTCLTVELFLKYINNPHLIIICREGEAVARSLERRDGFSPEKGRELNRIYEERVFSFIEAHPEIPRLILSYETVLEAPLFWVKKIAEFLEIKPEQLKIKLAAGFIMPGEGV